MNAITTKARNAGLEDILTILQEQRARRLDVVVRQPMIDAYGGRISYTRELRDMYLQYLTGAAGQPALAS